MFKTIFNSGMAGAAIAAAMVGAAFVVSRMLKNDRPKGGGEPKGICTIRGEVVHIEDDRDTGMSRITVRDSEGTVTYGYSGISAKELNALYSGKGMVSIPVISKKAAPQPGE